MDSISITCSNCRARLKAPPSAVGKTLRCPKCHAQVSVEGPPHSDEEPVRDISSELRDDAAPVKSEPATALDARGSRRRLLSPPGPPGSFIRRLNTVYIYPFTSFGGVLFLLVATSFWAISQAMPGCLALVCLIVVGGYVGAYMFNVLLNTASGNDRAPMGPGALDWMEIFGNFFRFFFAFLVAFGPAIGLLLYAGFSAGGLDSESKLLPGAVILLGLFGVIYYPMTLMLIGFSESWSAGFNYVLGVRSILRIPGDYFLCCLFFVLTFVGESILVSEWLAKIGERDATGRVVATVVTTFLGLYLYVVQMRALGLLYITNKNRLGWFR